MTAADRQPERCVACGQRPATWTSPTGHQFCDECFHEPAGDARTRAILDDVDAVLGRFVAFPSDHARHAVAAWALHCWALEAFESTPRLALLSPEKGSGKTRTLEVLELLVPGPTHTVNMSAAVLFRLVGSPDAGPVTLLLDEADTYLGLKSGRDHEDLRGLVNAGHRRGAKAFRMRMEGGAKVEEFPAFAPVALAGIGDLPDTIIDRAVVIAMKRRSPAEHVDPFRRRPAEIETAPLRDALDGWAGSTAEALVAVLDGVVFPDGIVDRAAEVWEPLLAVGTVAGEPWTTRLREAAVALNAARIEADPSLGVMLLRDARLVLTDRAVDRITSVDLAEALTGIEGAPWADLRGAPIDPNGIARRLKKYGIRPGVHRFGATTARGYLAADFADAWNRYLPPPPEPRNPRNARNAEADDAGTDVTGDPRRNSGEGRDQAVSDPVTPVTPVTPLPGGPGEAGTPVPPVAPVTGPPDLDDVLERSAQRMAAELGISVDEARRRIEEGRR